MTWMPRSKITSGFVEAAIPFMDKAAQTGKPFFVNLWPDDVHSPFWPPVEKWRDGKRALYLAVLEEMDRQLGRLFDHLRDTPALRDNTIVLVCSDNGPEPGAGSAGLFRGAKTTLYEGGVRSPLIVWAPGLMESGKAASRNERSVFAAIDIAPSLIALAGADAGLARFDGENLAPVLLGKSEDSRRAPIFWSRPPDRKTWGEKIKEPQPDLAMREGSWKFLCDYDGSESKLYDLTTDFGEAKNLAASEPEVVQRMKATLLAWHKEMTEAGRR